MQAAVWRSRAVGVLLLLLAGGCKGAPDYDRSSPDATLESFFKGLNKKRFPEDLAKFLDEQELKIWTMRCRSPGCAGGTFRIVSRGEQNEVRAVLYVDYVIEADNGVHVMKGDKSPVSFAKEGKSWLIVAFGRQRSAPQPLPTPKETSDDASPPQP
jgi:hypothetical protein